LRSVNLKEVERRATIQVEWGMPRRQRVAEIGAREFLEQVRRAVERRQEINHRGWFNLVGAPGVTERADLKARKLLAKFLSPDQQDAYNQTGRFLIVNGDRKFLIGNDMQVRVYQRDDHPLAPPLETWCVFLPNAPIGDTILAQLLMLKDNPEKLRKRAIVTPGHRRSRWEGERVRGMLRRAGYTDV